jgi:hypothetical protein
VQDRPVFCLSGDRVLIAQISACFDAVFCFFDDAVRSNPAVRDAYGKHVAQWMEPPAYFAKPVIPTRITREAKQVRIWWCRGALFSL